MSKARKKYVEMTGDSPDGTGLPKGVLASYRSVFGHGTGANVLADMLLDLGLFRKLDGSEGQTALHNHAVELLRGIGVLKPDAKGELDPNDMRKIVSALMGIPE